MLIVQAHIASAYAGRRDHALVVERNAPASSIVPKAPAGRRLCQSAGRSFSTTTSSETRYRETTCLAGPSACFCGTPKDCRRYPAVAASLHPRLRITFLGDRPSPSQTSGKRAATLRSTPCSSCVSAPARSEPARCDVVATRSQLACASAARFRARGNGVVYSGPLRAGGCASSSAQIIGRCGRRRSRSTSRPAGVGGCRQRSAAVRANESLRSLVPMAANTLPARRKTSRAGFRPSSRDLVRDMPRSGGRFTLPRRWGPRLLDATGLHHPRPPLVVLPNASLLVEYRAEFAGTRYVRSAGDDFGETPFAPGAPSVSLRTSLRRSATTRERL